MSDGIFTAAWFEDYESRHNKFRYKMEMSERGVSIRMSLITNINLISVFFVGLFLLPLVIGFLTPLTGARIFRTLSATAGAVSVITAALLGVIVTNYLFSNNGDNALANLFANLDVIRYSIISQDVLIYILFLLIITIAFLGALQLLFIPLYKKVFLPLSDRLGTMLSSANSIVRRLVSSLWQLPKSIWLVLVFALLFNFYSVLSKNAALGDYIIASVPYRLVEEHAIRPIVASDTVQQIPAFINTAVEKAVDCLSPEGRKLLIKIYINGVTVEDAVRSSPDIDNVAIDLVDAENDGCRMAKTLYDWVSGSISYDHAKADQIETDAFATYSGAVPAFNERTGVCFDKACLYVAMCRAVGIRVRLITGLAFNGSDWLDHSWNQIYAEKDGRWVNVDTTFGSKTSNYFDNADFFDDHKDAEIQGEW